MRLFNDPIPFIPFPFSRGRGRGLEEGLAPLLNALLKFQLFRGIGHSKGRIKREDFTPVYAPLKHPNRLNKRLLVITSLILVSLLGIGCKSAPDFDSQLSQIAKPYSFSLAEWEFETISSEIRNFFSGKEDKIEDEAGLVREYFNDVGRIKTLNTQIQSIVADGQGDLASLNTELNGLEERRAVLKDKVERIIAKQITETLAEQGIFNPIDEYIKLKVSFPPLSFELEKPPNLLVISPRDRIESIREVLLKPETHLAEKEDIEARVDELGVSSLVVTIGGMATYPSFVTDDLSLQFTIYAATEEWVHQYLAFKPMGFLYLLDLAGVSPNYEIATMNETLAGMVSKEIGAIVYDKYYTQNENIESQEQTVKSDFDFNLEMRELRRSVDKYLEQGEIEQAEALMEQKRQCLASQGYYIRKLNQAFFAFYGTYADSPTSVSPIGRDLQELRSQSASLKAFLNTVAAMNSYQDLKEMLNKNAGDSNKIGG